MGLLKGLPACLQNSGMSGRGYEQYGSAQGTSRTGNLSRREGTSTMNLLKGLPARRTGRMSKGVVAVQGSGSGASGPASTLSCSTDSARKGGVRQGVIVQGTGRGHRVLPKRSQDYV